MPHELPSLSSFQLGSVEQNGKLEPGDILAFYGTDWRSRVIELATLGPSHVGIVANWDFPRDMGGFTTSTVLVESTSMCAHPCLVQREFVSGVQVQCPYQRMMDYGRKAKIYRLAPHWKLFDWEMTQLTSLLHHWLGKPYDTRGALWSGTRLLKWLPRMPYSDLGSLFCSELIAASLQRLGRLCVSNAGLYNPATLVRTLVKSGVYLPGVPV